MFKKTFGKLHLWFGLASGLIIFIVALSGSVLAFREELDDAINRKFHFTQTSPTEHLSYDSLSKNVVAVYPKKNIKSIYIPRDAYRNVIFRLGNKKEENILVYVDPYKGNIIGQLDNEKKFVNVVLRLHRFLLMKETGKTITGISCAIFLFMVISGLIIWWPKNKQMLKQRLRIKRNASFKRKNWDLHSVAGFYSFIFLFVIALTGLVIAFKPVNELLFKLADGKKPPKNEVKNKSAKANDENIAFLDKLVAVTNSQYKYSGDISINFPTNEKMAIAVNKNNAEATADNISSSVYFDRNSGEMLKLNPYEKNSLGQKIRRMIVPIHSGSVYGWPTKLISLFVGLFAASLPVTGTLILINRKRKKKNQKAVLLQEMY
jgi:uncharacterized iron-regulated membrane protein